MLTLEHNYIMNINVFSANSNLTRYASPWSNFISLIY